MEFKTINGFLGETLDFNIRSRVGERNSILINYFASMSEDVERYLNSILTKICVWLKNED